MPTSGKIKKDYVKYGEVLFSLKKKQYKLSVYQSIDLLKNRKYRGYLFIPFRDATSGKETYGGGRYIDLTIPKTDTLIINFNFAYHPYCAYKSRSRSKVLILRFFKHELHELPRIFYSLN